MRYTPKRKAAIIIAIQEGRMSEADVKREHGLSTEEITEWVKGFAKDGMRGLKVNIQRESKNRPFYA